MFPTIPTSSGSNQERKQIPAGTHLATIYGIVYAGAIKNSFDDKIRNVVYLLFEFPNCPIEIEKDGQKVTMPMTKSLDFTYSFSEKANLRAFVASIMGRKLTDQEARDFNIATLVGKSVLAEIITNTSKSTGNPYNTFSKKFTSLMAGMPVPQMVHEPTMFSVLEQNKDAIRLNFSKLPNWLKTKIAEESLDYKSVDAMLYDLLPQPQPVQQAPVFQAAPQQSYWQQPHYSQQQQVQQQVQQQQQQPVYQQQAPQVQPNPAFAQPQSGFGGSANAFGRQDDVPF